MLKHSGNKENYISDLKITKILSRVPKEKEFKFYTGIDQNTGKTASNLESFAEEIQEINIDSVKFHLQRNDFQKWLASSVGDVVLAGQISEISGQLSNEDLREQLAKAVSTRIVRLRLLHDESIPSQ